MEKSEIRRIRELEKENVELKKALGEHVIMLNATQEVLKKRVGTKGSQNDSAPWCATGYFGEESL